MSALCTTNTEAPDDATLYPHLALPLCLFVSYQLEKLRVLRHVQEKERRGPDNADATQNIQIPDSALRSSQYYSRLIWTSKKTIIVSTCDDGAAPDLVLRVGGVSKLYSTHSTPSANCQICCCWL